MALYTTYYPSTSADEYPFLTSKRQPPLPCRWCGYIHGDKCPIVKAIEYYPNGAVKRVEFWEAQPLTINIELSSVDAKKKIIDGDN